MSSRIIYVCIIITIAFAACSTNTRSEKRQLEGAFKVEGLTSCKVFKLKTYNNALYGGTNEGLYKRGSGNWQFLGPPKANIRAFVILSELEYLASVSINNRDSLTIAKTVDGGKSWFPFRNGYEPNNWENIASSMTLDPSHSNVIYAGGPGGIQVAKSVNQGKSWELVSGVWSQMGFNNFIKINKQNPNNIWAGGQTSLYYSYLISTKNAGKSWKTINIPKLSAPVTDLVLKNYNPKFIMITIGFGPIWESTDGGETWFRTLRNYGSSAVIHSTKNETIVYASGITKNNSLFLAATSNFGETWEVVEADNTAGIFVNDMISVMQNGREVLYFATNKGVYSYTFEK